MEVQSPPKPTATPVPVPLSEPAPTPTPTQTDGAGAPENPSSQTQQAPEPAVDPSSKNEADAESSDENPKTAAVDNTIKFNQQIIDFAGDPIAGLKYRVIVGNTEYNGITDEKGLCQEISGLLPLEPLEILVCKSNGDYASKYKGFTQWTDMNVCAVSPHIKVPFTTDVHEGEPVATPAVPPPPAPPPAPPAPETPAKPKQSAPPAPTAPGKGEIDANGKGASKDTTECRNASGHPTTTLKDRIKDWAKRHRIPTFGIWSWDDFKPDAKGCTNPAAKDKAPAESPPGGKASSSAPAPSVPPSQTAASTKNPGNSQAPVIKVGNTDQAAPKQVTELIKIMEEQTGWEWKKMFNEDRINSLGIKTGILNGTFTPRTGKDVKKFNERCYPSVKIGTWRAGIVNGFRNDIQAKGAGPWLEEQGFVEISKSIPDARWALPGDVIVYRYPDAKEAANLKKIEKAIKKYEADKADYELRKIAFDKELSAWQAEMARRKVEKEAAKKNKQKYVGGTDPKKPSLGAMPAPPDDNNNGHIDVRSYDGYLSDFNKSTLPTTDKFLVIGIYRKIFDPIPDLRLRAFLKVIREWECHAEHDDAKRYFMLPVKGTFTDTRKHPFEGKSTADGTPSGAYQITLGTYRDFLDRNFGLEPGFTPAHQDRMAVAMLEHKLPSRSALAEIRKGNIEAAVDIARHTWASLPGGTQCRHEGKRMFTMTDVLSRYNDFLKELIAK